MRLLRCGAERAGQARDMAAVAANERPLQVAMQHGEFPPRLCVQVACVGLDASAEAAVEEALVPAADRVKKHSNDEEFLTCHAGEGRDGENIIVTVDPWNLDGGPSSIRSIGTAFPRASILVYTTRSDRVSILQALMAGANGYILQPASEYDLACAVGEIIRGRCFLCARSWATLISVLRGVGIDGHREHMTSREHEVMACLIARRTLKQTAEDLGVAEETVRTEMKHLYLKLGARRREQAVATYLRLK